MTNPSTWLNFDKLTRNEMILLATMLKNLGQFVQSDWFLPEFISHDKDTADGAPDWSIQTQGIIFILKVRVSCYKSFLVKVFKNDNKGIVFKARWFVRPDINTDVTINCAWNDLGYALVIQLR